MYLLDCFQVIKSNWQTGRYLLRNINCCTEYSYGVNCLQYDDTKIITGSCDWTLKIWDKNTLECVKVVSILKILNYTPKAFLFRF